MKDYILKNGLILGSLSTFWQAKHVLGKINFGGNLIMITLGILSRVYAAMFNHANEDFYAFYFEEEETFGDYFDDEGGALRKAFLRAPLNFSRISSSYSKRRKHPCIIHLTSLYSLLKVEVLFSVENTNLPSIE
ncbi:hypothetical protein N9Y26_01335 [bacterium]|nr:hypothetical protein [bacterium]